MPPLTRRKPAADERRREPLRVGDDLPLVVRERRLQRFLEAHRLGRDDVHQRSALHAGEDACDRGPSRTARGTGPCPPRGPRSVLCVVVVTKSECGTGLGCTPAATRPAMCAMSVTIGAPIAVGDRADPREVDHARIGAGADDDHLRLVLVRQPLELVVVDPLVVLAHAVGDDRVELAGEVERMAVRQVAAVRQVHAEHGVARLQQREVDRHVRLRAGVRLHVGVLGAEQLLGARDGAATRRRRRTRSRRSSACPDSLRRTCWSAPSPAASSTAWLTKFSEAISSRPVFWRCRSLRDRVGDLRVGRRRACASGDGVSVVWHAHDRSFRSRRSDRCRRWWRPPSNGVVEPERDDLVGEAERDDPAAHREDVGVVVLARQPRGVEIVAERGADAADLVGGDLLALAAAAERRCRGRRAPSATARADVGADRRIVDRRLAVRAAIVDRRGRAACSVAIRCSFSGNPA